MSTNDRRDVVPLWTFYTVDVGQAAQWLTANQRLHWHRRAERTKAWREATAWRARQARIPRLDRALIVCELRFAVRRRRDPANWAPTAKACVDGLVDAGVFDDDDATRVQGPDMRLGAWGGVGRPGGVGVRLILYPRAGSGDPL